MYEDLIIIYEQVENSDLVCKAVLCIYSIDLGPAIAGLRIDDIEEDMRRFSNDIARSTKGKHQ